jgi:nucleoside-diphosphate-sugar epimerase
MVGPGLSELKRKLLDVCNGRIEPCVRLWGTGTPRREFLYSDDMADACVFLMNLPDEQFRSVLNPTPSGPPSSISARAKTSPSGSLPKPSPAWWATKAKPSTPANPTARRGSFSTYRE